jgi:hypothetical protein
MRKSTPWPVAVAFALIATAASAKEHLAMAPYPASPAWVTATDVGKGDRHLREQIPAGQDIDAYRDILVDEAFPEARTEMPSDFLTAKFAQVSAACEGVRVNGPKAVMEDGYPVAYAQIYCSRQKGQSFGVNLFFKVIQGSAALYSIHREFRVPPSAVAGVQSFSKDQMAEMQALMTGQSVANRYLVEGVQLCGDRSKDPRCQ